MAAYDIRIAIPRGDRAMRGDLTVVVNTLDEAKAEVKKLYDNGHAALCQVYMRWTDDQGEFHYEQVTI